MNLKSDVDIVSKLNAENFYKVSDLCQPVQCDLLKQLLNTDDKIISLAIGSFGLRCKYFVKKSDLEHPEVGSVIPEKIASIFSETIILTEFAKAKKLFKVIEKMTNLINYNIKYSIADIDDPAVNLTNVRFVKDLDHRNAIRSARKCNTIELHSFYKNGEPAWRNHVESFKPFFRFSDDGKDEVSRAEDKLATYTKLKMNVMCSEIEHGLEILKQQVQETKYGFHRITLINAVVILAKLHGFVLENTPFSDGRVSHSIKIPSEFFKDYCFDGNNSKERNIDAPNGKTISIPKPVRPVNYNYTARSYPISQFTGLVSENINKIINYCEKLPELNGKPAFDHYVVLVPSVELFSPKSGNVSLTLKTKDGNIKSLDRASDAYLFLDRELVASKIVVPILLGERENKTYFLSYFV